MSDEFGFSYGVGVDRFDRFALPRCFGGVRSLCLWAWCVFHSVVGAQLAALGRVTTYRQLFQLKS